MVVFATETSCDETSICLMENSSIVEHFTFSQEIHKIHGGVVPELASRSHLEKIQIMTNELFSRKNIHPNEIDVFSATCGPGLIGSLLVGSTFTKSLAISFQKPFIPINHLEGHILSTSFNNDIKFPSVVLLLTGGHTQVYLMKDERNIELLGQSVDDAIGEAFDKTAKLIGLSYPGGAEIEREAVRGDENRFILPKPLAKENNFNFSFSGIKTHINILTKKNKIDKKFIQDLSASFQKNISYLLIEKLERRLKRDGYNNIFLAEGGKTALEKAAENKFDLILLDLMMPDMSGLEVLKHLKGDPLQRSIPVIMVTASDEVETAAECIINGADDFITKPFNGTLLKARVGASLEKKRLRDTEENYLDRVETDKKRSQQILKTVMPTSVANELQSSGKVRSRRHDDVAILICDLVGFTTFCEKNDPELVVETLQGLVENFEKAFEDFGLEKIKTVGDAIVAVAGLSSHAISPVKSCVDCSYKLREIANSQSMPWNLHLGIHSGSLVAGTVGTKTVQFDILGKTVNVAFNICDMSESNQILISSDAWMTARNEIKVKSIGLKRLKSGQDIEMLECV